MESRAIQFSRVVKLQPPVPRRNLPALAGRGCQLFLGTREDNFRDMVRKNRHGKSRGSHNGNSKLTKDKVRRIRQLYVTGKYNQRDLAAQFGVTQPLIGYIVRREIWTWLE